MEIGFSRYIVSYKCCLYQLFFIYKILYCQADWTIAACADAGANCFIAGSGMFAYDDLSEGCQELRTIAEAAQKGLVLPEGETIAWLEEQKAVA